MEMLKFVASLTAIGMLVGGFLCFVIWLMNHPRREPKE
jgi:preprotein translocase subunit Sss1